MTGVPDGVVSLGEDPVSAWRTACERLAVAADAVLAGDPDGTDVPHAEVVEHLGRQVVCWLGWSLAYADPALPAFHRNNDLVTPWGGPNVDNVYRHARIEPGRRYRITGRMHGCEEFALAIRAGFMHMPVWGTLAETSATDLGLGPDDEIDILLGGDEPGALPIPDGATMVTFREYYLDWQPREPAAFTIGCLDDGPALPAPAAPPFTTRLAEAVAQVERSLPFWDDYLRAARAKQTDNSFAPPLALAKGLSAARYAFCFFDLGPDEALVVDSDVPDARYWSLQLYSLGTFQALDPVGHMTSLNHRQARVDPDGRLRVVLAGHDPGVANWLDSCGRRRGLLTFRWFWSTGRPEPTARVVGRDQLDEALAPDSPRLDPAGRAAQLRARREHLAWRFRT